MFTVTSYDQCYIVLHLLNWCCKTHNIMSQNDDDPEQNEYYLSVFTRSYVSTEKQSLMRNVNI